MHARERMLVTGGAGFIGSHLVEALLEAGFPVRVVDNLATGHRSNLAHLEGRYDWIEGDVADFDVCRRAVQGVSCIFHQAAIPSVPRSVREPISSHASGPTATLNLLEAARQAGARRFVFAASSSAYGDTIELPKHEDMLPKPLSPVARPSSSIDIGAFQDRGFVVTIVTGEGTQTAAINTRFANPLAVFVTSPFGDPVQGGAISFTVTPSGGASAKLSAGTATIGAGGLARVTAVANGTAGSYTASTSARGVATPAVFALSNLAHAVSVTAVSVGWGTQTAALQTAADGIRLLPAGRKTDLPWLGIDRVTIILSQAATLIAANVTVSSAIGINYGPVTVSGSGTSYTITLAQPIDKADRVTITISATIATFTRRLDVLPGDFNDDGVVNSQDMVGIRNEFLAFAGAVPTIFGDINGDGKVDINDYNAVKKLLFTTLPPIA